MDMERPSFAFSYKQIFPVGDWQQHSNDGAPRPPNKWGCREDGFQQAWHAWTAEHGVHPLTPEQEADLESIHCTSIVWCQYSQNYWIYLGDCTQLNEDAQKQEDWHRLYFYDLGRDGSRRPRPRPGLWKLLDWGDVLQHPAQCPERFEEFLPENLFTAQETNLSCHFVGDLSLILGLLAMCPKDQLRISEQIARHFRRETFPQFISAKEHRAWDPIVRTAWPGRALVMQTGTVPGYTSPIWQLKGWAAGDYGPLVSSHQVAPTRMSA